MNTITKKLILLVCCIIFIIGSVWMLGLFPIMRVNGEFVWYQAYSERVSAHELFESKSRLATGGDVLTPALRDEIHKSVLKNLIVELIFEQYIRQHSALSGLEERTRAVVASTLKEADPDVLPRATKELYGWSVEEFSDNVLFPQALLNELQKEIEKDGASFEEFVRTQLNNAQVQLYVVPWKWEKGEVVD